MYVESQLPALNIKQKETDEAIFYQLVLVRHRLTINAPAYIIPIGVLV